MGGRASRRKGHDFEREMVHEVREVYPRAKRGIGQARSAGDVADVEGTPWWVECKHKHTVSIQAAMEQGEAATDGRPTLVLSRVTGKPVLATMRWRDLKTLLLLLRAHRAEAFAEVAKELEESAQRLLDEVKNRGSA